MRPRFLADADFNFKIVQGLRRPDPVIDFQSAKESGIRGMPDCGVLDLAARSERILVSHDRKTMPGHFARFIEDRSSPGLIILSQDLDIRTAIDDLLLLWLATRPEEWRNQIRFLPL